MNPPTSDALQNAVRIVMDSIAAENSAEYGYGDVKDSSFDSTERDIKAMETAMKSLNSTLYHRLSALQQQRNSLVPIARLPAEILALIFEGAMDHEYDDRGNYDRLLQLSNVCTYWRSVSNNSADLWKTLTDSLPRGLINLILSKQFPLHIIWNGNPGNPPFVEVCSVVERWQKFSSGDCTDDMLVALTQLPSAPELRALDLTVIPGRSGPVVGYPQNLFGGVAPHLKSLSLVALPLPWNSGLLNGLTELTLLCMGRFSPSVSELRIILSNNPNLTTLVIEDCKPAVHPDMAPQSHPMVVLPKLAVLHLVDLPMDAVLSLLHCIHAPALDRLRIRATRCNSLGFDALCSGLCDPLRVWLFTRLKTAETIFICLHSDQEFNLTACRDGPQDQQNEFIDIGLESLVAIHPSVQALVSVMPPDSTSETTLALHNDEVLHDEQLFPPLANIPCIKNLRLVGEALDFRSFLILLKHPTLGADGVPQFTFPFLTELSLDEGMVDLRDLWDLIRIRDSAASSPTGMPKRIESLNLSCTVSEVDEEAEAGIRSLISVHNFYIDYLPGDDDVIDYASDSESD